MNTSEQEKNYFRSLSTKFFSSLTQQQFLLRANHTLIQWYITTSSILVPQRNCALMGAFLIWVLISLTHIFPVLVFGYNVERLPQDDTSVGVQSPLLPEQADKAYCIYIYIYIYI